MQLLKRLLELCLQTRQRSARRLHAAEKLITCVNLLLLHLHLFLSNHSSINRQPGRETLNSLALKSWTCFRLSSHFEGSTSTSKRQEPETVAEPTRHLRLVTSATHAHSWRVFSHTNEGFLPSYDHKGKDKALTSKVLHFPSSRLHRRW